MTTPTAAASTTKTLSLDLSPKSTSPANEPGAFASKLQDARRDAKPEAMTPARETKKPGINKAKRLDDDDDRLDAAVDAKPAQRAEKPTEDRPVESADDVDASADKPADEKPTAKKTTDDVLLAALAASATPLATSPDATPVEAKSDDAARATSVATVVAAATIQANTPAVLDDQAAAATGAPKQRVEPNEAGAKAADAKLDALTAKLKPVADPNAPLPPDATEQHAGGDGQKHSSNPQHQQTPGDGDASIGKVADVAAPTPKADAKDASFDDVLSKLAMPEAPPTRDAPAPTPAPPALRPEQQFARDNVDRVVGTVQAHVEAGGNGTMNVRLDPPELGALDVAAKMLDGKMSVSFTTSNEQATQLLSHSLSHLKSSLESAGIAVDRIEVRQAAATPTNASADREPSSGQQQAGGRGFDSATQQQGEQQRKQMVDRLWRKYAYGSDEVDLVA